MVAETVVVIGVCLAGVMIVNGFARRVRQTVTSRIGEERRKQAPEKRGAHKGG
jgi:hypothetical protein